MTFTPFTAIGTLILLAGVAWFVRTCYLGYRDGERERTTCSECGAKFDRVAYFPTSVVRINEPHYYCPNDHIRIGTASTGESQSDRLGGWAP
jgi:hypothetical protein